MLTTEQEGELYSYFMNSRVAVLGAAGMVGSSLWPKLEKYGASVVLVANDVTAEDNERYFDADSFFHSSDINGMFKGKYDTDIVFNCAGHVGGAATILNDPSTLIHDNLRISSEYIQEAVKAKVGKFVYISSSYVYPDTDAPALEYQAFRGNPPDVHYGLGWIKRYFETLCIHHHRTSSTDFVVVRPTNIYGPWDNFNLANCHVVPALIRKCLEADGTLEVWGNGDEVRNFTYVDDFTDGLLVATMKRNIPEGINLCYPEGRNIRTLVKTINEIVADIFWTNYHEIVFNLDKPQVASKRLANPVLFKELHGYECQTDLRDGLRQTILWYIKAKLNGTKFRD